MILALLQNGTLKPVHYLIKHEEILPHQKHDSHPILADYGTDQFSIHINDKGNDIFVKLLRSFSFKSVTPIQTKFKTPIKNNNKTLHQQSLLINDTDITSDDEDHIYTRIPKYDSSFSTDTTLQENFSILKKSPSAINVRTNSPSLTHCSQVIPFYDTSFFKYKNYFQGFFLLDDYSLDINTLQQQQSQDPVLRTVYSCSFILYFILYSSLKTTYSYNELPFFSEKISSFMVQAEHKPEHKSHTSLIRNTPDKLSSVMNNRTLRDLTNFLDPYKRNLPETPFTTLTHILHCYDRTHKLLQTPDLDSQRITQSSQANQSALESITTLFTSTNLH